MADTVIPDPSTIIDQPQPGPPAPAPKTKCYKVFDGRLYTLFSDPQRIATQILTMDQSKELAISTMYIDLTRCDLTKIFADGGWICSGKNID